MTGEALFIVPTVAARRKRLEGFLEAFEATRTAGSHLLIAVDETEEPDGPWWYGLGGASWLSIGHAPPMPLGPKVNYWARIAAGPGGYPYVGFLADDCVPETEGWDAELISLLKGRPGIAYPQSRRNALPEHWLISSEIVRALGWVFQPDLAHYYADVVLSEIGTMAGCLYPAGCIVRHDHYDRAAGVEHDQVYRDAEAAHGGPDGTAYKTWQAVKRMGDVLAVRAAIDGAVP